MAETIYQAAALIALTALMLAMFRMFKGPTIADRVVALDAMTIISISILAFVSATAMRIVYLDVALVYGLISFVGVVAVARYMERGL